MQRLHSIIAVGAILLVSGLANAADTLLVKTDGKLGAGIATKHTIAGNTLVLELAAGADGAAWARTINERLTGAKATFVGGKLSIFGIPPETLIDQLTSLSLEGDADPLAELGALGGGIAAVDAPEGGGSIRASKPSDIAMAESTHDADEYHEADVVEVKKGVFPQVVLKLKMRKPGRKSPLKKDLRWGKVIDATVMYNSRGGAVDYGDASNQNLLIGWYLTPRDRVRVHLVGKGGTYSIDWLSRE